VLAKRFNRSNILDVKLVRNDKILSIKTSVASAYKEQSTYLQLEFTGKFTNIIILDQDKTVLEALRHIDLFSSYREVRVGQKLKDLQKAPFKPKEYLLDDVEQFLYDTYKKEQSKKLELLKKQKLNFLEKKLKKLKKLYDSLESKERLFEDATKFEHIGNLILLNAKNIKPYTDKISLNDYDGSKIELKLEKLYSNAYEMSNDFFAKSKKAKQRAKNLHIEEESLISKIKYIKLFMNSIKEAKDITKIEILFPKQQHSKKVQKDDSVEVFWIEGYKILLGKNEKGNIKLLQNSKSRDIWVHMKDRASAHVIIKTDKQNVPIDVIKEAGRLCVDFTTTSKDRYLVDYTQRREVSIQSGANVLYNKYKTLEIDTTK